MSQKPWQHLTSVRLSQQWSDLCLQCKYFLCLLIVIQSEYHITFISLRYFYFNSIPPCHRKCIWTKFIFPFLVTILANFVSLKILNLKRQQFPDKETSEKFGKFIKQCFLICSLSSSSSSSFSEPTTKWAVYSYPLTSMAVGPRTSADVNTRRSSTLWYKMVQCLPMTPHILHIF